MSPIIITSCNCSPKKKIYISIPRELYFKEGMQNHDWQLEYSKRVKEEKYEFYKENVISEGDIWIEYNKEEIQCEKCGKNVEL